MSVFDAMHRLHDKQRSRARNQERALKRSFDIIEFDAQAHDFDEFEVIEVCERIAAQRELY